MRSRLALTAACLGLVFSSAAGGEYDFFARARYPGPVRRHGVDLYKVVQGAEAGGQGYRRRVVQWWPRKGVDSIAVHQAMPLRTWTLRARTLDPSVCGKHLRTGVEELTRRVCSTREMQFKAHLVGFRGIGNRYGDPFGPEAFFCPAVVLRLADGTKRCFTRGTFVEADEKFILGLYLKEMQRVRATLCKEKYPLGEGLISSWPNSAKPGEPGTMRVESEHFVWVSGSQQAPNESFSPWVSRDQPDKARLYREGSVAFAEDMWAYHEYAGVLMPYWDRPERRKYAITVCGTYRDGYQWLAGYAGGGYGGCGIKHAGGGPWALVLGHEWGHGLALQTRVDGGGGEILADACSVIDDPASAERFSNNVRRPWRNCMHGSYRTGLFYAIMGDDPNWGYALAAVLPVGAGEPSIFHTLARVGEQRGLFANGVRGVGDMMGEFAARQAEFDCELQDGLRRAFISVRRSHLEAVDRKAGRYRIPWGASPEAFGANIIRLVPAKDASRISVDFRGFHDSMTHGDWRACIVAVDAGGKTRYSPLWSKGVMEMAIREGDRRHWLTVAATPSALISLPGGRGIGHLLDGRHAYRYPYEVKLSGCRPGTPHNLPGDTEDYDLTLLGGHRDQAGGGLCVIPHPGDTPQAARLRKGAATVRPRVDEFKAASARQIAARNVATDHWMYYSRFAPYLAFLDRYVTWMQAGVEGHRHPNGGGWVAASARVAATAYVAPDAMVLDGAKVLDHAAIEDFAVVRGPRAVVSGRAKVGGQAYVEGNVRIGGFARVLHPVIARADQIVPSDVPLRPFQRKGEGHTLWANYAMDQGEAEVLEDWFRYKDEGGISGTFHVLSLNGHLHGGPRFVADGERRGFAFDGKTQYAEASPILADLGQITVDIALKWDGGASQAIFDFGSSAANCFVLTPAGASGKAELVITRQGKTERIVADAAVARGKWTQCRLEIDGKKIAIWLDGRQAAGADSSFRPADVYPPGAEKRNFLAATRNATGHFKGVLDSVGVYHAVHDDFASLPSPRRHASRRVTREFIDSGRREYADVDLRQALIDAKVKPLFAYYEKIGKVRDERQKEMDNSQSPQVAAARKALADVKRKLEARRSELRAEFEKLPQTLARRDQQKKLEDKVRELNAQRTKIAREQAAGRKGGKNPAARLEDKALVDAREKFKQAEADVKRMEQALATRDEVTSQTDEHQRAIRLAEVRLNSAEYIRLRLLRDEARADLHRAVNAAQTSQTPPRPVDPRLVRLDREIRACRDRARTFRTDPAPYLATHTMDLTRQLAAAEMRAAEAFKEHVAQYKAEYDWVKSYRWLGFSRHYNYPHLSYLRKRVAQSVGGRACHENFGSLESIRDAQTNVIWHTRCDWQWLLKKELDGSIEDLPLLQKWLQRVRGEIK